MTEKSSFLKTEHTHTHTHKVQVPPSNYFRFGTLADFV